MQGSPSFKAALNTLLCCQATGAFVLPDLFGRLGGWAGAGTGTLSPYVGLPGVCTVSHGSLLVPSSALRRPGFFATCLKMTLMSLAAQARNIIANRFGN